MQQMRQNEKVHGFYDEQSSQEDNYPQIWKIRKNISQTRTTFIFFLYLCK